MPGNISEQLMQKISCGTVQMRPKWHFAAASALAFFGLVVIVMVTLFLAGFFMFSLRVSGLLELPSFGWGGWPAFLDELPWFLIAALVAFFVAVEIYARRFSFAYRRPVIVSVGALIALVLIAGVGLGAYLDNDYADDSTVGMAVNSLRAAVPTAKSVHVGTVSAVDADHLRVMTENGEIDVEVGPDTVILSDLKPQVGDDLLIMGEQRQGQAIKAEGVKRSADHHFCRSKSSQTLGPNHGCGHPVTPDGGLVPIGGPAEELPATAPRMWPATGTSY